MGKDGEKRERDGCNIFEGNKRRKKKLYSV